MTGSRVLRSGMLVAVFALWCCFLLGLALGNINCRGGGSPAKKTGPSAPSTAGEASGTKPSRQPAKIDPATAATVRGVVSFAGTPPKRPRIQMTADPYCASVHQKPVLADTVVVNKAGRLRDVVVYVSEGLDGMKFNTPADPVLLEQKGCEYVPHVIAVMAGQSIDIRNEDETLHNIHALPTKNAPFNFGQPRKGMTRVERFSVPELDIRIKCDVHPWMNAACYVFDNPFHDVTDAEGTFDITGLPPGTYTITAQHDTLGTKTQDVTLGPSETKDITFTFGD